MIVQYEELRELLAKWKITIVPKEGRRVRGYDADTYRKLAKQTESIDYHCEFQNGICQGRAMGGNGCCSQCADTFGYWRKEDGTLDEESLRRMSECYDARTGFLREGEGCVLPRELRSPTCLYIFCSDEKMSGEDKHLLYRIHYGANWS